MHRIFQTAKRLNHLLRAFPKLRRKVDSICVEYHQHQENFNYDLATNGERWLVEKLAAQNLLRTVFDVGANHGDWAKLVLAARVDASLHCFEICPPTFEKLAATLKERSDTYGKILLNPIGLSDSPGTVKIKYCPGEEGLSTMFDVVAPKKMEVLDVKVMRAKDYCTEHNLQKIDCLKIDVEGAEHLVLQGFDEMLTPEKVPVVQFEYGRVNILTKFLLKDFYDYFEGRGYRLGKLFPNFVRFRPYRFEDEDFLGPNYIAASPQIARLLE